MARGRKCDKIRSVLTALMADIHANREAFEACLVDAREQGADRLVFLGDYVNYGADPEWVVTTLMEHVARGGIAILGNHDAAVGQQGATMSSPAEAALEWTRVQLGAEHRAFLAGLPLTHDEDGLLFVHTGVTDPAKWAYVTDTEDAALYLKAVKTPVTVCGHVHKPALYNVSPASRITAFRPVARIPVPLLSQRRWLAVVGSVGQPRDGNPAAAYALLDDVKGEITTFRVPYDIEAAAEKIRAAGLPEMLADRLKWGL